MQESDKRLYLITVRSRDARTGKYSYDTSLREALSEQDACDQACAHFRDCSANGQYGDPRNYSARPFVAGRDRSAA